MTLEGLLEMSEEQVCELLQKFGASEEECARLNASLSCLRKAHQLGRGLPKTQRRVQTQTHTRRETPILKDTYCNPESNYIQLFLTCLKGSFLNGL